MCKAPLYSVTPQECSACFSWEGMSEYQDSNFKTKAICKAKMTVILDINTDSFFSSKDTEAGVRQSNKIILMVTILALFQQAAFTKRKTRSRLFCDAFFILQMTKFNVTTVTKKIMFS